ncbi:hypothetical protein AAVH_26457 [Aphelenchoides avenae]|nr:hypothetical protein AAVH_26457 [Aphelenchus avenae]
MVGRALVPLCSIFPPESIMIVANALGSPLGFVVSGYLSLVMTAISLVNPLATICLVRTYREGFLGMMGLRKKTRISPPTTSVALSTFDAATATQPINGY